MLIRWMTKRDHGQAALEIKCNLFRREPSQLFVQRFTGVNCQPNFCRTYNFLTSTSSHQPLGNTDPVEDISTAHGLDKLWLAVTMKYESPALRKRLSHKHQLSAEPPSAHEAER